ncbi:MAG TPA: type VII secretion protein EccB [Actinocatenispora sp.]
MATRQDQLHSYQFMIQRVISALVMRETDPAQTPLRRGVGAVFAGVMIAILVGAGFGVYGIFTGIGSLKWKTDGSVVVEKETGATFVYRGRVLHPMLNYASALLASGGGGQTYRVNAEELRDTPRGIPAGIPGAPNSLPPASAHVGAPWTLCSVPGKDVTGASAAITALTVGQASSGGTRLGAQGLLVRDSRDQATYLLWNGHRYRITDPDKLVPALFGAQVDSASVGTALVNGVPAGLDIGPIDVPGHGSASAAVNGRNSGDVLEAQTGSGPQYYLVFPDGVAPITALQKDIIQAQYSSQPQHVSVSEATAMKRSSHLVASSDEDVRPPAKVPPLHHAHADQSVCAEVTDASGDEQVVVGSTVAAMSKGVRTTEVTGAGAALADRILVPPGRVAIVRSLPADGAGAGTFDVVTDIGQRFPVPSAEALGMLGYSPSNAVSMPAGLVHTIPAGPTLDPSAALTPATPSGR